MAKYDPLIKHLRDRSGDETLMTFRSIEDLLGERLPPSAKLHKAWWANSSRRDSHTWAHAWQEAGWKAHVQIASGTVKFERFALSQPSVLDTLRPTSKHIVMNLVRAAEIDVTAWGYSDGQPYRTPQSNPKYCYDWSFGSPREGYVLCVWHEHLAERNGRVVYDCDMGTHTRKLQQELARTALNDRQRSRLLNQIRRAQAFEAAVSLSYNSGRALRMILNLGDTRDEDELADTKSEVSERELDSALWYVHTMDDGDALIVRGELPTTIGNSTGATDLPPESPGADDEWREGQIRVRQGQPEFRAKLMEAYGRKCAITGTDLELLNATQI